MKFLVKNKERKVPDGYKEIELPVGELSLILSATPFVISAFPTGFSSTTVNVCNMITNGVTSIMSLPITTVASGVTVVISSALLVSELADFVSQKTKKNKPKELEELENEISKVIKYKMKMRKSLVTQISKGKEEK